MRRAPLLLGAAVTVVLVVFAGGYGYHRDELYFLEAGHHLAWSYADQGPVTPLVARLMSDLAPGSLTVLRIPSAIAAGLVVVLTGLLAGELGGRPRARALAAACAAVGTIVLFNGHLLSTSTLDLLVWTLVSWLVVRAVRTGDDRLWPVAGVVLGLGLLNKPLPAFLAVGLLAGVLIAGPRRLLRNPWVWSGAAIALVLWSPWIVWQASNGWPQIDRVALDRGGQLDELAAVVGDRALPVPARQSGVGAGVDRRPGAPVPCPGGAPLPLPGLGLGGAGGRVHGQRRQALLPGRAAAGAAGGGGDLGRRWLGAGPPAACAAVLVADRAGRQCRGQRDHLAAARARRPRGAGGRHERRRRRDHRLARLHADRHGRLSHAPGAVILTSNYGEAGAIDRYGPALGLPHAYSGHNAFGDWGPPPNGSAPVVAVGLDRSDIATTLRDCRLRVRINDGVGIDNDEQGAPVDVCRGPQRPWSAEWSAVKHLG